MASAFLERLKQQKNPAGVQDSTEDDADGYRTLIVERRFLSEPVESLGIQLTPDAQILSVRADGPGRKLPVKYFIVYVNDQFVDSSETFYSLAQKDLRLVLKVYNGTAMEELLARILMEDNDLDVKALFESTPRFAFLAASHPLFFRWTERSRSNLEAKRLLQGVQERAEEQAMQESLRALQETAEKADEEERLLEEATRKKEEAEEAERQRQYELERRGVTNLVLQETLFRKDQPQAPSYFDEPASPDHATTGLASTSGDDAPLSSTHISNEELLRIVSEGGPPPPPGSGPDADELRSILFGSGGAAQPAAVESIQAPVPVKMLLRYRQPYKLTDGTTVEVAVKERYGPKPLPPTEDPPKATSSHLVTSTETQLLRVNTNTNNNATTQQRCSFCQSLEHIARNCLLKRAEKSSHWVDKEAERLRHAREKEVCRDFQRGKCTRHPCPFLHQRAESPHSSEDRHRKRSRTRSRSKGSRRRRSPSDSRRRVERDHSRDDRRDRDRHDERRSRRDEKDSRRDDHYDDRRGEKRDDRRDKDDRRDRDSRRDKNDRRERDDNRDERRRRSGSRDRGDGRRTTAPGSSKSEWSRDQRRL